VSDRVVLLLVDAFSSKYLKENLCPTLYELSRKSSFALEPLFGFEGIGAAIYSGAWPNTTHVWTEYVLGQNEIIKRSFLLQKLVELTDLVPSDRVCFDTRYVLFKLWGEKYARATPAVIPSELIMQFRTKIQKNYPEKNCLGSVKTIFDVLRENGMVYEYLTPSVRSETNAMESLCKKIGNNALSSLTLLHLPSLDALGHKYGPLSEEVKKAVKKTDKAMKKILDASWHSSDNVHILIFSDHGMSPVRRYLDVWKVLARLPIELLEDYIVFLDSTMARFWFFSRKGEQYVKKAFSGMSHGRLLSANDFCRFRIDKVGKDCGEMIFAVDDGVAIYPDFFRRHDPPRGMHGYASPKDNPILLIHSPNSGIRFEHKRAQMIDILPTILDLLNLQAPKTCEGTSLVGRENP
jgi:hypothetical protein